MLGVGAMRLLPYAIRAAPEAGLPTVRFVSALDLTLNLACRLQGFLQNKQAFLNP